MIRPDYYKNAGIEVFDIIDAFGAGLQGMEAFAFGNCLKYLCRYKNKNGLEDLKKAQTYLEILIQLNEEE